MNNIIELQSRFEFDVYPKREIAFVKGLGTKLYDAAGNEYLDCAAGIGVGNIGHSNKQFISDVTEQLNKLVINPGIFYNDTKAKFLEKLHSFVPKNLTRTFLCNSGTEAIEAAIKFTRFTTGKKNFVCAMKSFHGRTMGSLSATFKKEYKDAFQPLVPGFSFAPFNKFDKFEQLVDDDTAGIILELIQGEGGINIAEKEFIQNIRKLCDDKGIILIIDEIQTGVGRTGKFLAIEHYGIEADILCMAKALGGGIPIGAVLCSDKIDLPRGKHGSTFGGNPLACTAGLSVLNIIENDNLIENAQTNGYYFYEKLKNIDSNLIRDIRSIGLMIGIELKTKVKPYLEKLLSKNVVALPAGTTVIRLLPPLTITKKEIDSVVTIVKDTLDFL